MKVHQKREIKMTERSDNVASRDGRFGWDDVVREREAGKAELDRVLAVLVQVARGEKGRSEVQEWILANYPERLPL